jgi:polysaccharide biosynthesis protein PslH
MNILQICTKVPYPPKDGGAAGIFVFSEGFARLGHQVTIFAINPPRHHIETSRLALENITILPVNTNTAPDFAGAFINLVFTRQPYHTTRFSKKIIRDALIALLKTKSFDIIQLEGTYMGGLLPDIRKHSKAKVSLRAHNVEHKLWEDITKATTHLIKRIYLGLQSKRLKRFELNLIRETDCLIPVSELDYMYLNALIHCRSRTIPYGVRVCPEHSLLPYDGRKDICYIGALDWIPNQEAIMWFAKKVCPLLLQEMPELSIHVAGRNAPEFLKSLLRQIPNIIFYGEVEHAAAFMQSYKAMVVPLFTGSGMRVKIVDALNVKLPVICTPKASEGTPLKHRQHILLASNEKEFVQSIQELLSNNVLANNLREEGYQYICKHYNSISLAEQMINFIES